MKFINYDSVKIKNLLGIIEKPSYEDLLYEIINFLTNENQENGEFKLKDVSLKTSIRINVDLIKDLEELIKLGYIENIKNNNYRVIKHLWE